MKLAAAVAKAAASLSAEAYERFVAQAKAVVAAAASAAESALKVVPGGGGTSEDLTAPESEAAEEASPAVRRKPAPVAPVRDAPAPAPVLGRLADLEREAKAAAQAAYEAYDVGPGRMPPANAGALLERAAQAAAALEAAKR